MGVRVLEGVGVLIEPVGDGVNVGEVGVSEGVTPETASKAAKASIDPQFVFPGTIDSMAEVSINDLTWVLVSADFAEKIRAAKPETCGAAMEVPKS